MTRSNSYFYKKSFLKYNYYTIYSNKINVAFDDVVDNNVRIY